jgi:hypothetical protein
MSMDVITRDRKEIRWNGLPSSATEELSNLVVREYVVCLVGACGMLSCHPQRQEEMIRANVEKKREHLAELVLQVPVARQWLLVTL